MINAKFMSTVWSAAPTPFLADGSLDTESIKRLAEWHYARKVRGTFIAGTSGEGPFMSNDKQVQLAQETVKAAAGRIAVAVQITDNSAERMIDNLKRLADTGINVAVIAPPFFCLNPTQDYICKMYAQVIEASPVDIGLYLRRDPACPNAETLSKLAQNEKVIFCKDSVPDETINKSVIAAAMTIKQKRPFYVYCGDEFKCDRAALMGYDGLTLGGGCFNSLLATAIFDIAKAGKTAEAKALQEELNRRMFEVFGGPQITCWLAGQKQLMVDLGVFTSNTCIINYQLNDECAKQVRANAAYFKEACA